MNAGRRNKRDAALAGAAVEQSFAPDHIPPASEKNLWIEQELKGSSNPRAVRRMQAIEVLLKDEGFLQHKISGDGKVRFHHGIEAMKFLVEAKMMKQEIDQFNDTEIERIVAGARALAEERLGTHG